MDVFGERCGVVLSLYHFKKQESYRLENEDQLLPPAADEVRRVLFDFITFWCKRCRHLDSETGPDLMCTLMESMLSAIDQGSRSGAFVTVRARPSLRPGAAVRAFSLDLERVTKSRQH